MTSAAKASPTSPPTPIWLPAKPRQSEPPEPPRVTRHQAPNPTAWSKKTPTGPVTSSSNRATSWWQTNSTQSWSRHGQANIEMSPLQGFAGNGSHSGPVRRQQPTEHLVARRAEEVHLRHGQGQQGI